MSKINHIKKLRNTAAWIESKQEDFRNIADTMMDLASQDRRHAMRFYEIAQRATQTADLLFEEVTRLHQEANDIAAMSLEEFRDA